MFDHCFVALAQSALRASLCVSDTFRQLHVLQIFGIAHVSADALLLYSVSIGVDNHQLLIDSSDDTRDSNDTPTSGPSNGEDEEVYDDADTMDNPLSVSDTLSTSDSSHKNHHGFGSSQRTAVGESALELGDFCDILATVCFPITFAAATKLKFPPLSWLEFPVIFPLIFAVALLVCQGLMDWDRLYTLPCLKKHVPVQHGSTTVYSLEQVGSEKFEHFLSTGRLRKAGDADDPMRTSTSSEEGN
jgi:hypothetical protein